MIPEPGTFLAFHAIGQAEKKADGPVLDKTARIYSGVVTTIKPNVLHVFAPAM
jgi:hypothetical protein